jgi:hypothetical protein
MARTVDMRPEDRPSASVSGLDAREDRQQQARRAGLAREDRPDVAELLGLDREDENIGLLVAGRGLSRSSVTPSGTAGGERDR